MGSVIVLPSAMELMELYRDRRFLVYSDVTLAMRECCIIHGKRYHNLGPTSQAALNEAFDVLGIERPYTNTLGRGCVHDKRHDPLNGFLEYTSGMAYCVWPWQTIIHWLTNGWPTPSTDNLDSPTGTWVWHRGIGGILPNFDIMEVRQLKAMKVPKQVIAGERLMTQTEAIEVAATVLYNMKGKGGRKPKHMTQWNQ